MFASRLRFLTKIGKLYCGCVEPCGCVEEPCGLVLLPELLPVEPEVLPVLPLLPGVVVVVVLSDEVSEDFL